MFVEDVDVEFRGRVVTRDIRLSRAETLGCLRSHDQTLASQLRVPR